MKEGYSRGLVRQNFEDYQGAIEDYTQALQLNASFTMAFYNRGVAYLSLEKQQKALADFNQVLQINPDYADAYISRGTVRHQLGETLGAIDDYTQALRINPAYTLAYLKRGITYSEMGNKPEAIKDYNQALQIEPNSFLAYVLYLLRGKIRFELGDLLGGTEDCIQGFFLQGESCHEKGDYQGAIEAYTQVLEIDPNNHEAYNGRSTARSALGDFQGAMEDLEKAISFF